MCSLAASKEFRVCSIMDFYRPWGGCLSGRPRVMGVAWFGLLLRLACPNSLWMGQQEMNQGQQGVLCNAVSAMSLFFLESIGVRETNEAELLGIRRTLSLWVSLVRGSY